MISLDANSPDLGELSRKALRFCELVTETVRQAKAPGFGAAGWAAVAAMVDVEAFGRIGCFRETMDWPTYVAMLTQWATTTDFYSNFRRISETGNLVFMEVEEHNTVGGVEGVINSMTVFNFDDAGKIRFLNVYMQSPNFTMPQS
jgi:hypothetical protein